MRMNQVMCVQSRMGLYVSCNGGRECDGIGECSVSVIDILCPKCRGRMSIRSGGTGWIKYDCFSCNTTKTIR